MSPKRLLPFLCLGFAGALASAAAPSDGGAGVLARLHRGQWVVKPFARGAAERTLCLRDPKVLLHLEHGGGCKEELVASDSGGATAEYSCGARGFAHTSVRLQTPRAATIDTQGLIDGRPFSYRAVARRAGPC
jgi:hypothetical protein